MGFYLMTLAASGFAIAWLLAENQAAELRRQLSLLQRPNMANRKVDIIDVDFQRIS